MEADAVLGRSIRRNTALLSATMAVNSAFLQLAAAVSSITFVSVSGVKGLLGLGPAIVLTAQALTAFPAGRSMDRFGRVPVIAGGFVLGTASCLVTAAGPPPSPSRSSSPASCFSEPPAQSGS